MGRGVQLASGRVIALGRLLLASLFVLVVWLEPGGAYPFPAETYLLLVGYVAFASLVAVVTWNNWWLDAHLAGPAHAVDIGLFTCLVYLTEGDKRPFFSFFIFVLLSAAIRWGWRATALTAALLTLLYISAGMFALPPTDRFEFERFVSGTGYLIILSLILIWFGVNQRREAVIDPAEEPLAEATKSAALENGLRAAMTIAAASAGVLVWSSLRKQSATALVIRDDTLTLAELKGNSIGRPSSMPFLYDLSRKRALMRDQQGSLRSFRPGGHIEDVAAAGLRLTEGLAVPVFSGRGEGQIYLESGNGMFPDHLMLGPQLAAAVATKVERRALMRAAEESAESRSRLAVARDLHDSVVQFLAGAAFRLEAMIRSEASGRDLTPELNELKDLMLQEQGELRSFIGALRGGSQLDLEELAKDLQLLASRLSRQWEVQCTFSHQSSDIGVSTRVHLDAQQLVREAVANAARHAGAKNVSIRLAGEAEDVRLDFINDGTAYPKSPDGDRMPRSLRERVEAAGGTIELSRGMGVTKIAISLPAAGRNT